ncbi:glycosyltransferase family 4 protein [Vibrio sp.]|uniref:glycosyltransferase family 4 protein n=1 Tax=Vibrio sp. TaxID=678 RepID=UPI003F6C33C5
MKKLVIIQNRILHYRIPLFNALSRIYDLTVVHSGEDFDISNVKFKVVKLGARTFGTFQWQNRLNLEIKKISPDVIVSIADIQWVGSLLLSFTFSGKFVWWGFDKGRSKAAMFFKYLMIKQGNTCIFYNDAAKSHFDSLDKNSNFFIANNTFDVGERVKAYEFKDKDSIIFVGSFDQRKRLADMIDAFGTLSQRHPSIIFRLVGDGMVYKEVESLIENKKLNDRVILVGRVEDPKELRKLYQKAYYSVSFGQAGLSILQSLGFGVPFISSKNAISGGELCNIKDGYNGLLCNDDVSSLTSAMHYLLGDRAIEYGRNSYSYYSEFCTIDNMVNSFVEAIES